MLMKIATGRSVLYEARTHGADERRDAQCATGPLA